MWESFSLLINPATQYLLTEGLGEPVPVHGEGSYYFDRTASIAAGAGTTVVKASPGRLRQVIVVAAGTGSGSVKFYDHPSAANGTVIAAIPATIAVGEIFPFQVPAAYGVTVLSVSSGPALCVSYD
jgi:hypothetical protein